MPLEPGRGSSDNSLALNDGSADWLASARHAPTMVTSMLGMTIIRWTIRIAMLLFATAIALRIVSGASWRTSAELSRSKQIYRACWSLGALCFVAHVVAAMHFFHHWSHASALRVTAEETDKLMGVRFGEGIYFSYVFLVLWVADAGWVLVNFRSYFARSSLLSWSLTGYLMFIALNGAVVFEGGASRIGGLVATAILLLLAVRSWLLKSPAERATESSLPLASETRP